MVEHYSQRRLEKAADDHKHHSPIAKLYGSNGNGVEPAGSKDVPGHNLDIVVNLAKELGAARERIKQLEAVIEHNGYKILVKGVN